MANYTKGNIQFLFNYVALPALGFGLLCFSLAAYAAHEGRGLGSNFENWGNSFFECALIALALFFIGEVFLSLKEHRWIAYLSIPLAIGGIIDLFLGAAFFTDEVYLRGKDFFGFLLGGDISHAVGQLVSEYWWIMLVLAILIVAMHFGRYMGRS